MAAERLRDAWERLVTWLRRGGRQEAVPLGRHGRARAPRATHAQRPARARRAARRRGARRGRERPRGARTPFPACRHGGDGRPRPLVEHPADDLQADRRRARVALEDRPARRRGLVLGRRVHGVATRDARVRAGVVRALLHGRPDPLRQGRLAAPAEPVGGVVLGWDEHLLGPAPGGAAPEGHGRRARRRDPLQRPRRRPDRPPPARSDDRALRAAAHPAAGRRPRPEARGPGLLDRAPRPGLAVQRRDPDR